MIYLAIVGTYDLPKHGMADIGPWRGKGKIVVDLTRHADSRRSRLGKREPSQQTPSRPARTILLRPRYRSAAMARSEFEFSK
jgi:hypothetical protein